MKQTQVVEEILLFMDKIMEQKPEVRREIMRLLKKHFDRFKTELRQVLTEGAGSGEEKGKKNNSGESERRIKAGPSILKLLKSSDNARSDMAILKEIFDKPLATRDERDW